MVSEVKSLKWADLHCTNWAVSADQDNIKKTVLLWQTQKSKAYRRQANKQRWQLSRRVQMQ